MSKYLAICFIALGSFYLTDIYCDPIDLPVSVVCLECLCNAASGCDNGTMCHGDACGPYRITKDYWIFSGTPTFYKMDIRDEKTFVECASNFYCSRLTVQGYMKRHQQHCNGDGKINCRDFLAIHALGPMGCSGTIPEDYKQRYDMCILDHIRKYS